MHSTIIIDEETNSKNSESKWLTTFIQIQKGKILRVQQTIQLETHIGHKITRFGSNISRLNRWLQADTEGKHTVKTHIISGHCLCEDKLNSTATVFLHHQVVLEKKKDFQDPR